jgi:multidrug efflux pump
LFLLVPAEIAPRKIGGISTSTCRWLKEPDTTPPTPRCCRSRTNCFPLVKDGTASRIIIRVPGSFGQSADFNGGRGIVVLAPWGERPPQAEVIEAVSAKLRKFAAVRANANARSSFSRGGGGGQTPVQFVLGGNSFEDYCSLARQDAGKAEQFPGLTNVDADYKETKAPISVSIDKTRAAELGVSTQTIGRTLETLLGQRRIGTIVEDGEEYDVIVESADKDRRQPSDLTNIMVRGRGERTHSRCPIS